MQHLDNYADRKAKPDAAIATARDAKVPQTRWKWSLPIALPISQFRGAGVKGISTVFSMLLNPPNSSIRSC